MQLISWVKKHSLEIIFLQSLVAMAGSLFFSEIQNLAPCILCWYQRISIYPIVAISAVAIWFGDKKAYRYILPLSIIGGLIAFYHNLLAYKFIPEAVAPCTFGVSCVTQYVAWFGFITIPFLSFVAFAVITVCALLKQKTIDSDPK